MSVDNVRSLTQLEREQLKEASPEMFDEKGCGPGGYRRRETGRTGGAGGIRKTARDLSTVWAAQKSCAALYGLRDSYPDRAPDGRNLPDARYLHRAARETL